MLYYMGEVYVLKMTDEPTDIKLKPIGFVRNDVKQPPRADYGWEKVISDIVVDGSLSEALDSLEDFSHIIVLYWMHRAAERGKPQLKIYPRGKLELPLVGLFATRSPHRPNPIGKATVRLIERRGNVLKVEGLDALDGTPVIDIKPYIPGYDAATDTRVPSWITKV